MLQNVKEICDFIRRGKMNYFQYKNNCRKIFEFYGKHEQKKQLIQECAELITALTKKDIDNIIKNVRTDVLVINFKDESSLKVVIDKNYFDDFSATIIKENKDVCYGETDEIDKNKGKNA